MSSLTAGYTLLFLTLVGGAGFLTHYYTKRYRKELLEKAPLLVIIPSGLVNPLRAHKPSEIELTKELYERLHRRGIQFTVEVAVHSLGEDIHFYIIAARKDHKVISRLIETLWPTGYVTEADTYDLMLDLPQEEGVGLSGGTLELTRPYIIPIKKATSKKNEPFIPLLRELSKLSTVGEGVAIQWVIRPATQEISKDIGDVLQGLKQGTYQPSKHIHEEFHITPENLKRIEKKLTSPLFSVNGRIVAGAENSASAETLLKRIGNMMTRNANARDYNDLMLTQTKDETRLIHAFLTAEADDATSLILNAEELASLFHFPGPETPVPKIKRR